MASSQSQINRQFLAGDTTVGLHYWNL